MKIEKQITDYIFSHPEPKRGEMEELNRIILNLMPDCKLWFLDGKNSDGKIISNPQIGYGFQTLKYADGKTKEFFQVGLSSNTSGISIYFMGIEDKKYLIQTYGKDIGKANVSGYCIKFKKLKDINIGILKKAILFGFENNK